MARYLGGLITLRLSTVIDPVFGRSEEALVELIHENPIEMLDRYGIRNGSLDMFIAYGGRDEFNIDAQVESFLYLCKCRGIEVGMAYDPHGHHDTKTAQRLAPEIISWLEPAWLPFPRYPRKAAPPADREPQPDCSCLS